MTPDPAGTPAGTAAGTPATGLGPRAAGALVFGSSAAVLVVELVALRLLAPYLGLTLETNTVVIGIALAAIALGSWAGGRAADVVDPRRTLGALLAVSGVVVALTPLLVRSAAELDSGGLLLPTATLTILVPGALLAAVTPMVTKLRLTTLAETGTVVGRLSGLGTAGSIAGTVVTGFVLVSTVPVSTILVGLGVLLVLAGVAADWRVRGWRAGAAALVLVGAAGLGAAVAPGGCDVETTYHCAVVEDDPERPDGRVLVLDGVRNSYVDLSDPTYLDFEYVQAAATVVDTAFPAGEALEAFHLGGGGLTLPRYLAEVRPGTSSVVSEIDAGVIEVDRDRLGLETGPDLEVRVEDGRLGLDRLADDSRDLVVGDAFGGVSVPWHLTTVEAVDDVHRVLRSDGVYVMNLIDHGPLAFVRAETATLREVFDHVAVLARPAAFAGTAGGNVVVVGSDRLLDLAALAAGLEGRDLTWEVRADADLDAFTGDAEVLTDAFAPVDQLLTPYGSA
ncbi:fused MFS/spermidine synthase [Nocardioides sp. Leaf285]|uniref:fused MFS/spermidine synthase n=1 Tax=Nocardioides sp. Leaf285 TaxID=1736322 RepID=UPI0007029DBE|nr:fused MFS/spermidine synthase [Nocardioides sp. Leaf285]KQP64331.1 spermidine synthase [Nocardioides sp. Leaf285]